MVLDQFVGSGTTILAAEKVARVAIGIEYEPRYFDVAILRWQRMTKLEAILAGDGRSFEDIASARTTEIEKPNARPWKLAEGQLPPGRAADDPRGAVYGAEEEQRNPLPQGARP